MLKRILLVILALIFIAAGLLAYFYVKAWAGGGTVSVGGVGTERLVAPAENILDSNIFKRTEINPFEGG